MNQDAIISMLWMQAVVHYLDKRGPYTESLLQEFGLTREQVQRADEWAPVTTFVGLQERAAEVCDDPYFGVRSGLYFDLRHVGPLGYAMLNAKTVRDSLNMFVRYQAAHYLGATLGLDDRPNGTWLCYHIADAAIQPRSQDAEAAAACGVRMVQGLGLPDWAPVRILFEHAPRPGGEDLERFFRAPVEFGQTTNAVVVDSETMGVPVRGSDAKLGSILERHLALLGRRPPKVSEGDDVLARRVREAIARDLDDGEPALESVARSLAMSGRTLQRELRKRSTAFRQLVEDVRHDLALEYMHEPDTAITQIAFMLGYSELSAFDRAFRRWTGTSPRSHRRQLGVDTLDPTTSERA